MKCVFLEETYDVIFSLTCKKWSIKMQALKYFENCRPKALSERIGLYFRDNIYMAG